MITVLEKDQYCIENDGVCFINGGIDIETSEYITRFIIEKNNQKENKPEHIKMIINSPGGYIYDCFAIIDIMRAYPIPIWTYGLGQVSSCGLLIFMSGEKEHRHIFKNASILSHQWSGGHEGKEHELRASEKENKLVSKRILRFYEEATGLGKEEIQAHLLPPEDVWLNPNETIKFGLADKIITKMI